MYVIFMGLLRLMIGLNNAGADQVCSDGRYIILLGMTLNEKFLRQDSTDTVS